MHLAGGGTEVPATRPIMILGCPLCILVYISNKMTVKTDGQRGLARRPRTILYESVR